MIYLDNAATSWPKPEAVHAAMDLFLRERGANPGRAGFRMAIEAQHTIDQAREQVKKIFGAPAGSHVVFTLNCTDALNMALKGLLSPGDHVLTGQLEHNSVCRPLSGLQKIGVSYSVAAHHLDGSIDLNSIKKAITPATKLIVLNHASNVLGNIQPIGEVGALARQYGIPFLVDAAQTAGEVTLNLRELPVDLIACPGHKGLLGPPGTGFLLVNGSLEIKPLREGGTGSASEEADHPLDYPQRLEAGTPNTVGIAALKASLEFLEEVGLENVYRHKNRLTRVLLQELLALRGVTVYGSRTPAERVGLVSFNLAGWDPLEAAAVLESRYNIACRAGLHCAPWAHRFMGTFPAGTLRFGVGYFNTEEEILAAARAVAAMVNI